MMPRFHGGLGVLEIGWLLIVVLVWVLIIAALVLGIRWLIRTQGAARPAGPSRRPRVHGSTIRSRSSASATPAARLTTRSTSAAGES